MCKSRSSQHPYHHHSHKSLSSGLKMEVQTQSDQKMKVATTDSSSISTVSTSSTSSQEEQQPQPLSSPTKSTKAIPSSSSLDPFQETMRAKSALHQKGKKNAKQSSIDYISWGILAIVLMITIFTYPQENIMNGVSIQHVFYNGWITAVATGVGVLPFFFLSEPDKYWMGISNAIAGGMMIAASYSLVQEAIEFASDDFGILSYFYESYHIFQPYRHSLVRTGCGFVIGIVFILLMKKVLDRYEGMELMDMSGASAQRMFLIVIVMTLHSLTEGIGLGVSFGGKTGVKLGKFITFSLAFHNVPEGLAVGLVMTGKKISPLRSTLWAIFTSLPQPLFAVPAYLFIEKFAPLLPGGLGFAAGAMSYVAVFELLTEAAEDTSVITTGITGVISFAVMSGIQEFLKQSV